MKKELPEFHVEMSHPENRYIIEPLYDPLKHLKVLKLDSLMEALLVNGGMLMPHGLNSMVLLLELILRTMPIMKILSTI